MNDLLRCQWLYELMVVGVEEQDGGDASGTVNSASPCFARPPGHPTRSTSSVASFASTHLVCLKREAGLWSRVSCNGISSDVRGHSSSRSPYRSGWPWCWRNCFGCPGAQGDIAKRKRCEAALFILNFNPFTLVVVVRFAVRR